MWGNAIAHGDRSVDVFVRKLAEKLEKVSPDWRYIQTYFGIGSRFAPDAFAPRYRCAIRYSRRAQAAPSRGMSEARLNCTK